MGIFSLSSGERREVELPVTDVENIGRVAQSHGATSQRDADRRGGAFGHPVVGHTDFAELARSVFIKTVRKDEELAAMYERARRLSSGLHSSVTWNSPTWFSSPDLSLEGPSVEDASALSELSIEIKEALEGKNIKVPLSGKQLDRALNVSEFALRVVNLSDGNLYPGLSDEEEVNSASYWEGLVADLSVGNSGNEIAASAEIT